MLDQIKKRRSIRKYTSEAVSDADVRLLLEAAMAAPSANDARPWEAIVVQRQDLRSALAGVHPWAHMCSDAPVVFVVLGDQGRSIHWVEDCSALTENLLLAVTGLGLGAVWVAVYPDVKGEATVRSALGIPQRLRVLCLVPVGHPAESKSAGSKFDERKVHFDGYRAGSS